MIIIKLKTVKKQNTLYIDGIRNGDSYNIWDNSDPSTLMLTSIELYNSSQNSGNTSTFPSITNSDYDMHYNGAKDCFIDLNYEEVTQKKISKIIVEFAESSHRKVALVMNDQNNANSNWQNENYKPSVEATASTYEFTNIPDNLTQVCVQIWSNPDENLNYYLHFYYGEEDTPSDFGANYVYTWNGGDKWDGNGIGTIPSELNGKKVKKIIVEVDNNNTSKLWLNNSANENQFEFKMENNFTKEFDNPIEISALGGATWNSNNHYIKYIHFFFEDENTFTVIPLLPENAEQVQIIELKKSEGWTATVTGLDMNAYYYIVEVNSNGERITELRSKNDIIYRPTAYENGKKVGDTLTVRNTYVGKDENAPLRLPATGGTGTKRYYLIGMMFIAFGFVYGVFFLRRRKRHNMS